MTAYINNFQVVLSLFVPFVIGFILIRTKTVTDEFKDGVLKYVFNICLPAAIIWSMHQNAPEGGIGPSFILIIYGFIFAFLMYGLGMLVSPLITKDKRKRKLIQFSFVFSNFTYMAYPVIIGIFGNTALFYASVYNITCFSLVFTFGLYLMKKASLEGMDEKFKLKDLLTAPTVAVLIGIILFMTHVKFPIFIQLTIDMHNYMTSPLAMLFAGMVLGKSSITSALKHKSVYIIAFFRLIVIPIIFLYGARFFGLKNEMLLPVLTVISMPVVVNMVLFSAKYKADSEYSTSIVVITTFLSVFTIPLILFLAKGVI